MRTIEQTVYNYDDLLLPENSKLKEKVLNNLYDINVNHNWWDFTYDDAENIGLKITSFDLDRNRHANGGLLLSASEVAQNILNEHGEECSTYKTAQSFLDEYSPVFSDYLNEESENYESSDLEAQMQDLEDEFLNSLLEDYSNILQKECEYLISEESILETIQANNYEFDINGNII